jgi:lipopolysaccharide export system protein LptA
VTRTAAAGRFLLRLGVAAFFCGAVSAGYGVHADTIEFTAKTLSGFTGKKTEYTLLEGDAEVSTSKIKISAERIELSGEDFRFVSASGKVRGRNVEDDMDFECETLRYDREREVVTLLDGAKIVDNPNEVTAQAERIEYNQQTGVAMLQINIELRQKDSVCTGAFAIYRKEEQMLELGGDPKIEKGDDVFRAREIVMNLETEEIKLDGRVRGTVKDSKEETPPARAPELTPDPPAPEQTPAPEQPPEDAAEGAAVNEGGPE